MPVAGRWVAEDVFECAGGGAGRHAHHTVNIRPFEVQAGVSDFADFAVVKDNAALALVHGVHAAAGADEDTKDDSASGNQSDKGSFAAHGGSGLDSGNCGMIPYEPRSPRGQTEIYRYLQ